MQAIQIELQFNRAKEEKKEDIEIQAENIKILNAKKLHGSILEWEDVGGLF